MNDDIITLISKDLKLDVLKNDLSIDEYRIAVIYSAAALWAKIATQDNNNHSEVGSRRHVLKVCGNFLDSVLKKESDSVKNYFYGDTVSNGKSPSTILIDSLIRSGELSELFGKDFKSILTLPYDKCVAVTESLEIVFGGLGIDRDYMIMSALSFIYLIGDDVKKPNLIDNIQWVTDRLKQMSERKPDRTISFDNDLYYDIHSQKPFSRKLPHDNYPFEIVLSNINSINQYYIKTKDGFYHLDEYSVRSLKDQNRFIFYLYHHFNFPTYSIDEKGSIIYVNGRHRLPAYEDGLIKSILWPRRNISDSAKFYGPAFLKPFVLNILNSLGVVIR